MDNQALPIEREYNTSVQRLVNDSGRPERRPHGAQRFTARDVWCQG